MPKCPPFVTRFYNALRSKASGSWLVVGVGILSVLVLLTSALGAWWAWPGALKEERLVILPRGASLPYIAETLQQAGAIQGAQRFTLAVRAMGLAEDLQAGPYKLPAHISQRAIVQKLLEGDVVENTLTIPEGLTVAEVLARLKDASLTNIPLKSDAQYPKEGSLFPDTYGYIPHSDAKYLLQAKQTRMNDALNKAWAAYQETTKGSPQEPLLKSKNELLILASIIEKETSLNSERAKVSGVFHNRLRRGMKLQTDPTVIYGLVQAGIYNGNLTRKHLRTDTPYNTYTRRGLPPTPIANPGKESLMAAAQPAKHDYLFFVAAPTKEGEKPGHTFSKTYRAHQKAVRVWVKSR